MASGMLASLRRLSLAFVAGLLALALLAAADIVSGDSHISVAGLSAPQIEEQLQVQAVDTIE